jgi:hypothetical protein
VRKVEGLHSYQAIAFITNKSNPRNRRLETKIYSALRISLQKAVIFSENTFSFGTTTQNSFNEKLGYEKWKR